MRFKRLNPIVMGLIALISILVVNTGFDLVPDSHTIADAGQIINPVRNDGHMDHRSRVRDGNFQVLIQGDWTNITVKGVNIGMAKPGYFPGDAAITYDEYLMWFEQIGEMEANTVRTYSIHPPAFYRALKEHNSLHPDACLYLLQGMYGNEEVLGATEDVFEPRVINLMKKSLESTLDVVFGNLSSKGISGIPDGNYDSNISDFILGLIIGQEWDPVLVSTTNSLNEGLKDLNGNFICTERGSPFEVWLAELMDHAVSYSYSKYSRLFPISFIHHQALDKLEHPLEPDLNNCMASIDPDHIVAKDDLIISLFATFHAYPYYPDFMTLEYGASLGDKNGLSAYGAYLKDLKVHHTTPILIGEFGLPSSMGIAHLGPNGMDQGGLTEEEQGNQIQCMFSSIVEEGLLGGVVFSWQDEWFKTTWNVRGARNLDGKPNWKDPLNCEESYGLMAFEPGLVPILTVDGDVADWTSLRSSQGTCSSSICEHGPLKASYGDEGYLYLLLDFEGSEDCDFQLTFDTLPGSGIEMGCLDYSVGADFLLDYSPSYGISYFVDDDYDILGTDGVRKGFGFVPFTTATGQKCDRPDGRSSGEVTMLPGRDYCTSHDGRWMEIRLPWGMLNFRDPSKGIIAGDGVEGSDTSVMIEGFEIFALLCDPIENGTFIHKGTLHHHLQNWELPKYHVRIKDSYDYLRKEFSKI